jgi:hypothetical protein
VNLTTGHGSVGDAQGDTLISIENVIDSAYDDTLTGGAGADTFVLTKGHDVITDFTPGKAAVPDTETTIDFQDLSVDSTPPDGYGGITHWTEI